MGDELCIQPLPSLNMHEAGTRPVAKYCHVIAYLEPGPKGGVWGHRAQGLHRPRASWSSQCCSKEADKDLLALDKTCTKAYSCDRE